MTGTVTRKDPGAGPGVGEFGEGTVCATCGYDLRGAGRERPCPECGSEARQALLSASDPRWLRRVRSGLDLVVVSLAVTLALVLGSAVAGLLLSAVLRDAPTQHEIVSMLTGILSISLFLLAPTIMGIWLVTSPEPGESRAAAAGCRRIRRSMVYALIIAAFLWYVHEHDFFLALLLVPLGIALFEAVLRLATHMARLARRIPARRLGVWTRCVGFVFVLCGVIAILEWYYGKPFLSISRFAPSIAGRSQLMHFVLDEWLLALLVLCAGSAGVLALLYQRAFKAAEVCNQGWPIRAAGGGAKIERE